MAEKGRGPPKTSLRELPSQPGPPPSALFYERNQIIFCVLVAPLCPTFCDRTDCSQPGSSVHGILQARILEWVAIPFSRGYSDPRIEPWSPALQADSLPSEQTLGDSGGQKGLVCCSPWHCQESVTTTATICIAAYGRGRKVIHLQVLLESHLQLPPAAVSVSLQETCDYLHFTDEETQASPHHQVHTRQ